MALKRSREVFETGLQKKESPYVIYGTPLPTLDDRVKDDGSFVPIWQQTVTDDRGRSRLHGAFTGGFSAGYFNTVGSKEGWTPSTFISSRQNRMKDSKSAKQQTAEDFMDDEDIREAEESKNLQTTSVSAGFGTEHDEVRKATAIDIFRPPDETMGVKLLKRMGWKEGQGIGPRTLRSAVLDDKGYTTTEKYSFAPPDEASFQFIQKTDRKGLGFNAGDNTKEERQKEQQPSKGSEDESDQDTIKIRDQGRFYLIKTQSKKKKSQKTGFGVGILNDTGSDDEDPYSMGPRISYNKVIGGSKKPKKSMNHSGNANPALKTKPVTFSKKLTSLQTTLRKCHDGKLPLEGYVLGDEIYAFTSMSLTNEQYKPPEIPPDWKSSFEHQQAGNETSEYTTVSDAARKSTLDARSRASALGEAPLAGKSVFDYMTASSRERLAQVSGKSNLPPAMGEKPPQGFEISHDQKRVLLQEMVPKLDQDVALQALERGTKGWMPYAEDEAKRERYRTYLEIRAGLRSTSEGDELPPRPSQMSQDDWVIEMQEFARAAEVFRPATGFMASRFTSSTSSLPRSSTGQTTDSEKSLLSRPVPKPENPADIAARMGMFGPMTRSFVNFHPSRLVCKRFNVPMPDPAHVPAETRTEQLSDEQVTSLAQKLQSEVDRESKVQTVKNGSGNGMGSASNVQGLGEHASSVNPDRNEAIEGSKPGQALFKAIFGSDDEDEDE